MTKIKFKIYKPQVIVKNQPCRVDDLAATLVTAKLQKKNNAALVFLTGATPIGMYARLVAMNKNKEISFKETRIYNLDEYYPIKKSHQNSYHFYMKVNLINHIDLKKENWFIPDGEEKTASEAARKYQMQYDACREIDLAVLSIGPGSTCHIGFNERGSKYNSKTRYIRLSRQTKQANIQFFKNKKEMPEGAITMGVFDILRAKQIVVLVKSEKKAWGVWRTLTGSINSDAPSSFLRLHPNVTFILDKEAASLI